MRRRSPRISRAPRTDLGALAQLVERFNGIEEVNGSTPLCSSLRSIWEEANGRQDAKTGPDLLQPSGSDRALGSLSSLNNKNGLVRGYPHLEAPRDWHPNITSDMTNHAC